MVLGAMEQIPQELDWVTVRAECTIRSVFKCVRREIEVDVAMRNKYLSESQKSNGVGFSVEDKDEDSFVVFRKFQGLAGTVSFAILGSCIKAINTIGNVTIEATIGMSDSGRCMLRVNESKRILEIETWQFRKKTLESLFFWC
jgi:hypothetical protein